MTIEQRKERVFVDDLDAQFLRFAQLRARLVAGQHDRCLRGNAARDARTQRLQQALRARARHAQGAGQNPGLAVQRLLARGGLQGLPAQAGILQLLQDVEIVLLLEKSVDVTGDFAAHGVEGTGLIGFYMNRDVNHYPKRLASAPFKVLQEKFGFTVENVYANALVLLGRTEDSACCSE